MKSLTDALKITTTIAARRTTNEATAQAALPVLMATRSIDRSTGAHDVAFLNAIIAPSVCGIILPMPNLLLTNATGFDTMNHPGHIQDENASAGAAGPECIKAGKSRAAANMAAADAHAASLKPILLELLTAPSHGKRRTPTGWRLSEIADGLNRRGLRTRTGKFFRPTTVKHLLDRVPEVVEAACAEREAKFNAYFKSFFGRDAPKNLNEALAGINGPYRKSTDPERNKCASHTHSPTLEY
jgi:hypothetical protein